MKHHQLVVVSALTAFFAARSAVVAAGELPPFIKICKKSDPRLNDCIKDSVERLKPYLAVGIPELQVPPCEPLLLSQLVLNQGRGPVVIRSTYSNIKIWGLTQFHLKSLRMDLQHDSVHMKVFMPHLYFTSDYEMSGRILLLPIAGRGRCHSNYTNVEAECTMSGQTIKRADGKLYYRVTDFHVSFDVGKATVYLSDLFNGDQQLGEAMNAFLNENWKTVATEIRPMLEKTIGDTIKDLSNCIYDAKSLDILLPD